MEDDFNKEGGRGGNSGEDEGDVEAEEGGESCGDCASRDFDLRSAGRAAVTGDRSTEDDLGLGLREVNVPKALEGRGASAGGFGVGAELVVARGGA